MLALPRLWAPCWCCSSRTLTHMPPAKVRSAAVCVLCYPCCSAFPLPVCLCLYIHLAGAFSLIKPHEASKRQNCCLSWECCDTSAALLSLCSYAFAVPTACQHTQLHLTPARLIPCCPGRGCFDASAAGLALCPLCLGPANCLPTQLAVYLVPNGAALACCLLPCSP